MLKFNKKLKFPRKNHFWKKENHQKIKFGGNYVFELKRERKDIESRNVILTKNFANRIFKTAFCKEIAVRIFKVKWKLPKILLFFPKSQLVVFLWKLTKWKKCWLEKEKKRCQSKWQQSWILLQVFSFFILFLFWEKRRNYRWNCFTKKQCFRFSFWFLFYMV